MKAQISGAMALAALLSVAVGAVARFVPSEHALGPAARIADSLAPWFLVQGLLFALFAALLGLRRVGAVVALAASGFGAQLYYDHHRLSLPRVPDAPSDVRILFFNTYQENGSYSDRIVAAAEALAPDVVVFAEANAMYPSLRRLQAAFTFVSPCGYESCDVLVASKLRPKRFWKLRLNPVWPRRYAVAELETGTGKTFFLSVVHLAKPWLSGISESEMDHLAAQYDWLPGPVVAVGDFNAAPWTLPMRKLLKQTGMRALRVPLATWPSQAGPLGIPIDHVLVHEGARIVRVQPFGNALNSNHRGFVVDVAIP